MSEPIEPIRRSVTVPCTPERAFSLFTDGMDRWWPLETHSRAAAELEGEAVTTERIEFQPEIGGSVVEHLSDGRSLAWGEVLVWDPPRRFVLAWRPHARREPPTEVEVRFVWQGQRTLVELEHRGWERLPAQVRDRHARYAEGWVPTLSRFAEAAERGAA